MPNLLPAGNPALTIGTLPSRADTTLEVLAHRTSGSFATSGAAFFRSKMRGATAGDDHREQQQRCNQREPGASGVRPARGV
jgi:hypothetical protein